MSRSVVSVLSVLMLGGCIASGELQRPVIGADGTTPLETEATDSDARGQNSDDALDTGDTTGAPGTTGAVDPDDAADEGSGGDDTSGTDESGEPPPGGSSLLIDDLEDGNAHILEIEGRAGRWYTFNDNTEGATQEPEPGAPFFPSNGGAGGSSFYAGTTGSGFTAWGAAMAVDLNAPDGERRGTYDVSSFTGVRFNARGMGTLNFLLSTPLTVDEQFGGECVPGEMSCGDHYGLPIVLTNEWTSYTVAFADTQQAGFGEPVELELDRLFGFRFYGSLGVAFEIAIDDLEFY